MFSVKKDMRNEITFYGGKKLAGWSYLDGKMRDRMNTESDEIMQRKHEEEKFYT